MPEIKVLHENHTLRLLIEQDLLFHHARHQQRDISLALANYPNCAVILDLSQVTHADSRGLKVLVDLYRDCQAENRSLEVYLGQQLGLYRILARCHLHQYLQLKLDVSVTNTAESYAALGSAAVSSAKPLSAAPLQRSLHPLVSSQMPRTESPAQLKKPLRSPPASSQSKQSSGSTLVSDDQQHGFLRH
ncbi:MAG: STAS domain-containing protein [Candidatus Melainabacteria bacterium]|nr:STAS domain-containing protein [Candidatus Melainabacteria bacterium]